MDVTEQPAMLDTMKTAALEGRRRRWLRLAVRFSPLILLGLALAAVLASHVLDHLSLDHLRDSRFVLRSFVQSHPVLSVTLYMAVYVGSVVLSLPFALVMTLTGGFLFGPWLGGLAASASSTTGACIVFLVSRLTVGDAVERLANPRLKAFEAGVRKDAFIYLLVLRLVPMTPFWLVNAAAGLVAIPARTFLIATYLGVLPGTLIYAGLGSGLGRLFDAGGRPSLHALMTPDTVLSLIGLSLLAILPIGYQRLRAGRAKAADEADAQRRVAQDPPVD